MITTIAFYGFATLSILFAAMVVWLRNPVTSALSLVASFFGISGVFVVLSAPFLGVIQILIYAGAILVLFLYVTMLLNLRESESEVGTKRSRGLAVVVAAGMGFLLIRVAHLGKESFAQVPDTFGSLESVGTKLLGPYALTFEFVSLVLLIAIVGAVVLSVKAHREEMR